MGRGYLKRDFWSVENRKYAVPGFRMQRAAAIIRDVARDRRASRGGEQCDLLDVGCGPAALAALTGPDVRYHGIDIAIGDPAPHLVETDFLREPIGFGGKRFDIVVALGVFEYMGEFQDQKFGEIADLLTDGGTFLVSYVNFGHVHRNLYWPYNNVRPLPEFRRALAARFTVRRCYPVGHNWNHTEPNRRLLCAPQRHLNVTIPLVSPMFGVEYFFICSRA